MSYAIEGLAILHGTVVCHGFSDCGPPKILYSDQLLPLLSRSEHRWDLVSLYGQHAVNWGFKLCALAPISQPEHGQIVCLFSDGTRVAATSLVPAADARADYNAIRARFMAETRRGGKLIEIGSRARSGNVYDSWYDKSVEYVGMDLVPGPNVDLVGDAHALSSCTNEQFDFALSISVFEHLLMPWKVALELAIVLRPGGIALIQSHATFPLHEQPWDFWRFSREAWFGLFNSHTGFEVLQTAYAGPAWCVPAFASGGPAQSMDIHPNYLISACLVQRTHDPLVKWDAQTADVYNLNYDHT